jgi:MarR family transcriptional regulator, transcriptional regulator for hemolysin
VATAPPQAVPDLAFLLSRVSHALVTELTARLAELGVSPRAHCVLAKAMTGEHTQSALADMSGLDKTTMVVTIDELERTGLAERRPAAGDRRARIIAVTDAGERMVEQAQAIVDGVHADVLSALPEGEREAFADALTRLAGERLSTPMQCEGAPRRRAPRAPATSL